jgi:hypothetical protein
VFAEAMSVIGGAQQSGIPVRLIGGLAVRYLTPDYPPRARDGQDLDLASVSTHRRPLSDFLVSRGYVADRTFNALYGHKQLYFSSPSGRAIDVLIDRLEMSHTLQFADRIERMPHTLDACDLLLSKLQIFELNEKDAQDALYLTSAFEVRAGDEPGSIGLGRFCSVLADDWGWWRTVTLNLEKIRELALGEGAGLVPDNPAFDPAEQLQRLRTEADETPKSLRWRLRAKVGERKRWYELPEETEHY